MNFLENMLLTTFRSTTIGDIANSGLSKARELFFGKSVRLVSNDELPENKDGAPKVSQLVSLWEAKANEEKSNPSPKQHIIAVVGSAENRLNQEQIAKALAVVKQEKEQQNQSIDALVIYGNKVALYADPGIILINPKKVIFSGARITRSLADSSLDDALVKTGKWHYNRDDLAILVHQHAVKSIDEALKHQTPKRPHSQKRYHAVYIIA